MLDLSSQSYSCHRVYVGFRMFISGNTWNSKQVIPYQGINFQFWICFVLGWIVKNTGKGKKKSTEIHSTPSSYNIEKFPFAFLTLSRIGTILILVHKLFTIVWVQTSKELWTHYTFIRYALLWHTKLRESCWIFSPHQKKNWNIFPQPGIWWYRSLAWQAHQFHGSGNVPFEYSSPAAPDVPFDNRFVLVEFE